MVPQKIQYSETTHLSFQTKLTKQGDPQMCKQVVDKKAETEPYNLCLYLKFRANIIHTKCTILHILNIRKD